MVNFPGRNGRRRRVLNEEVLSASSSHAARRAMSEESAAQQAPRYSDAAGVENHPQVTDFVPRRFRTIVLLALMGLATTFTLAGLHYFAPVLAASAGLAGTRAFDLAAPGSLASWVAAIVLLVESATCLLIYSIRRHRIDDYRGRYRIWFVASAACLLLSANSVAGLHHVLATILIHFTGWSALRDGAAWWLLLTGLPLTWIGVRALFDVKECGLAGSLLITAFACYVLAAASYLGFVPALEPRIETMVAAVAKLLGDWLQFAAVVSYARFVILDAQGLISVRRPSRKVRGAKTKVGRESKPAVTPASLLSVAGYSRAKQAQNQPAESGAAGKAWIDGSRPERPSYDDDCDDDSPGASKLSKADRKRLRKLKAQNRAA